MAEPTATAREPLTPEERRLLTDGAALAEAARRGPIVIANRAIEDLTLPAITFSDVRFQDVELGNVKSDGPTFHRCRFEGVRFEACDLSTPTFRESELESVTFARTRLGQPSFERCRLNHLRTLRCQIDGVRVLESPFDHWIDRDSEIPDASFTRVNLTGAVLTGTAFRRPSFDQVAFRQGKLENVKVSEGVGQRVSLEGVTLAGLELAGGRFDDLALVEVHGLGFRACDLDLKSFRLARSSYLANLVVSGGKTRGLTIEACPALEMVVLGYADIEGLSVTASRVGGLFIRDTRLAGGALFQACTLDGVQISACDARGLTLRDVTVETGLDVSGTRFSALRLERLSYSSPFTLVAAGATYQQGDSFPAR